VGTKTFKIEKYQIVLGYALHKVWGSEIKVRGALDCYGEGHRFIAYFLAEDSPAPKPIYEEKNRLAAIFLPFQNMGPFISLLRNEKEVFACVDSKNPERNHLSTSREPVLDF